VDLTKDAVYQNLSIPVGDADNDFPGSPRLTDFVDPSSVRASVRSHRRASTVGDHDAPRRCCSRRDPGFPSGARLIHRSSAAGGDRRDTGYHLGIPHEIRRPPGPRDSPACELEAARPYPQRDPAGGSAQLRLLNSPDPKRQASHQPTS